MSRCPGAYLAKLYGRSTMWGGGGFLAQLRRAGAIDDQTQTIVLPLISPLLPQRCPGHLIVCRLLACISGPELSNTMAERSGRHKHLHVRPSTIFGEPTLHGLTGFRHP
jgi:hypothetical protein